MSYLDIIPKELLEEIGYRLTIEDLTTFSNITNVGNDEGFWIRYYNFHEIPILSKHTSVFDYYKKRYVKSFDKIMEVSNPKIIYISLINFTYEILLTTELKDKLVKFNSLHGDKIGR